MHLKWDRYAQQLAFAEDNPDFVKKIEEKVLNAVRQNMRKDGVSSDKIQSYLNVLENAK
jgi:chorismate mutase